MVRGRGWKRLRPFFCLTADYCSAEHQKKPFDKAYLCYILSWCPKLSYNFHKTELGHHDNIRHPLRNTNDIFRKKNQKLFLTSPKSPKLWHISPNNTGACPSACTCGIAQTNTIIAIMTIIAIITIMAIMKKVQSCGFYRQIIRAHARPHTARHCSNEHHYENYNNYSNYDNYDNYEKGPKLWLLWPNNTGAALFKRTL